MFGKKFPIEIVWWLYFQKVIGFKWAQSEDQFHLICRILASLEAQFWVFVLEVDGF